MPKVGVPLEKASPAAAEVAAPSAAADEFASASRADGPQEETDLFGDAELDDKAFAEFFVPEDDADAGAHQGE